MTRICQRGFTIFMSAAFAGAILLGSAVMTTPATALGDPDSSLVVPGPPMNVVAVAGDSSAQVSWDPPVDAGMFPVSTYSVTAEPGGATCIVGGSSTTCTVQGLINGTPYTFRVRALNGAGWGEQSLPSGPVVPVARLVEPHLLTVVVSGLPQGSAAVIALSGPELIKRSVKARTVIRLRLEGTYAWSISPVLSGSKAYVAKTNHGIVVTSSGGANTLYVRFRSAKQTAPRAPENVSGTPGNSAISVSWAPPSSDGLSPIVRYTATAMPGGRTCQSTGILSCVIDGLTNGVLYNVRVVATNAVGDSPSSAPSSPVSPRTVPDPPSMVTATASAGVATVSWSAPGSDGGSPVTSYVATASPGGSSCEAFAPALSCTVTGLTNGQSHTFTVVARNPAGESAPSSPSSPVIPDYQYLPIGVPALDPSGMTVTVQSITRVQKIGSVRLTVTYTLTNTTLDRKLDEGAFTLQFRDGTREGQYGFFGTLFPGDSMSRSYTWEFLNGQDPLMVEYAPFASSGSLRWRVP